MIASARAGDRGRTTRVAAAGLVLAVLAEACSVGLLGLSGWFIASSAVAGATAYSLFSLMNPSGGVRAFAVGRIVTNYSGRDVLHSAALRRITAARLRFYDRAAARPGTHGAWSGQLLDRVMADADTEGMALIQATMPMVTACAMTAGGCLVFVLAGYPLTAAIVAVAAAGCAALAGTTAHQAGDPARARGALRSELVTAVGAWPEMASLGATGQLAGRAQARLIAFDGQTYRHSAAAARTQGTLRAITAAALVLTVVLAAERGGSVSTLVFLALLTIGVLGSAERLVAATEARVLARQAARRLDSAESEETGSGRAARPSAGPAFQVTHDGSALAVSGYRLPATPARDAREIGFTIAPGQTLFVTGASGSGKTTLLDAFAAALREAAAGVVTSVLADDYVFTGTVASNIRLADPAATDDDIDELLAAMRLDRSRVGPGTMTGAGGRDLSGGEQRRLHVARALATRPDVLLIDEPTTGLDISTGTHVLMDIRLRLPHAVLVLAVHELPADRAALGCAWSEMPLD
jgi:ATP-binding cassette subfamily C protein CydC